jgi:hypothetical protein
MKGAVRIINLRKSGMGKINNFTHLLEELPRAFDETGHPPEGFIKAAVVFRLMPNTGLMTRRLTFIGVTTGPRGGNEKSLTCKKDH